MCSPGAVRPVGALPSSASFARRHAAVPVAVPYGVFPAFVFLPGINTNGSEVEIMRSSAPLKNNTQLDAFQHGTKGDSACPEPVVRVAVCERRSFLYFHGFFVMPTAVLLFIDSKPGLKGKSS